MASTAARPELDALEPLRFGLQIMALRALRDPEAAEEAVQETLVRAVEALREGRLRDSGKLGAFVRGIARHVIVDTRRARELSLPLHASPHVEPGPRCETPLVDLITAEEQARVRLALTHLSERDQEILHLSFFEGLTPREIAERVNEPAFRIRKRKSRALLRLRKAFFEGESPCHETRASQTKE